MKTCTISCELLDDIFTLLNKQMNHHERKSRQYEKENTLFAAKRHSQIAEHISSVLDALLEAEENEEMRAECTGSNLAETV